MNINNRGENQIQTSELCRSWKANPPLFICGHTPTINTIKWGRQITTN